MKKALGDVVLFKLDAEKEGKELATEQAVKGFPTFVLMNADGATYDRWTGYTKEYLFTRLGEALADPTTLEEKKARLESAPTTKDALTLARIHESRGEYTEAVAFVDRAMQIDPAGNLAFTRFDYIARGFVHEDLFSKDEVVKAADAVVASKSSEGADFVGLVHGMTSVGKKTKDPAIVVAYIEPAIAATAGATDEASVLDHKELQIDQALLVTGDKDRAVALKRETMKTGWRDDAGELNSFAWWCFENGTNLEEAESLARRGIELAPPGEERAAVLDTAAEICNARGNCDDAVELIRRAVKEAPEREYYKKQLTRFEEEQQRRAG